MPKLTNEMKAMFEKQLPVIATANRDGIPNVGPKGSMHIIDDETLAFSESQLQKTFKNLVENPKVAVMIVEREKADGYQFKGTARILTEGDFFEKVVKRQESRGRPRPKRVVKIKIEEIYSLKPGMTEKRIN